MVKDMFKAVRNFTKNGKEQQTVKEYETANKAIAYARRYSNTNNFIKCEVFNEHGGVLFSITKMGKATETETTPKAEEPKVEPTELFTPENGDVTVKIHMDGESRKKDRICSFKNEKAAYRYIKKKVNSGIFISDLTVYRGDKILLEWDKRGWRWSVVPPRKRDPCRKNARAT